MSSFRNPEPADTPETGYNLFQQLNVNESGEISSTGTPVQKWFNSTELQVLYKTLPPIIAERFLAYLSNPTFETINANGEITNEFTHSGTGSSNTLLNFWNEGDTWLVARSGYIFYSYNNGSTWGSLASNLGENHKVLDGSGRFLRKNPSNNNIEYWNSGSNSWTFIVTTPIIDEEIDGLDMYGAVLSKFDRIGDDYFFFYQAGLSDGEFINFNALVVLKSSDLSSFTRTRVMRLKDGFDNLFENFQISAVNKRSTAIYNYDNFRTYMYYLGDLNTVDTTITESAALDDLENVYSISRFGDRLMIYSQDFYNGLVIGQADDVTYVNAQDFDETVLDVPSGANIMTWKMWLLGDSDYLLEAPYTDYDTINGTKVARISSTFVATVLDDLSVENIILVQGF